MSFPELAVVFVIGLLVLGPSRLPRAAREVGRWIGRARRTTNELRYLLEREMSAIDRSSDDRGSGRDEERRSRDGKSSK